MSKVRLNAAVDRAAKHIAKRVREHGTVQTDLLTLPKIERLLTSLIAALGSDYPLHAEGLQEAMLIAVYNELQWRDPLRETKDD